MGQAGWLYGQSCGAAGTSGWQPYVYHPAAQVRQTVLGRLRASGLPLCLTGRAPAGATRCQSLPLFQVMFMLHKAHQLDTQDLTPFGLGAEGCQLKVGGLAWKQWPWNSKSLPSI